jgi:predicted ATPase
VRVRVFVAVSSLGKDYVLLSFKIFHAGDLVPPNSAKQEDVEIASLDVDAVFSDAKELHQRLVEATAAEAERRDVNG